MDAAERTLLESTVRDAFAAAAPGPLDGVLSELGWLDMLAAEPRDAVDVVFTALGATNGAASALDDVVAASLGVAPRPTLAVLLPPFATWRAPANLDAGRVRAAGLATARATTADELLVGCVSGGETFVTTVPAGAADLRPLRGIDPGAGLHAVQVDHAVTPVAAAAAWEDAVALGRRAVAHQLAGNCRKMLDLARAHAVERVQFGRPIARFQAVRHRLADALVAVEALEATLAAAADEPGPLTSALAKAVAGRAARTVATHCQQVLAGIGFTTDHPFHRYLRRSIALEGLFGTADDIALDVGRQLVTTRRVPTLVEL